MNVASLIEDLKQYPPHLPVYIFVHEIYLADESGDTMMPLAPECDSMEAKDVKYDGCCVRIES